MLCERGSHHGVRLYECCVTAWCTWCPHHIYALEQAHYGAKSDAIQGTQLRKARWVAAGSTSLQYSLRLMIGTPISHAMHYQDCSNAQKPVDIQNNAVPKSNCHLGSIGFKRMCILRQRQGQALKGLLNLSQTFFRLQQGIGAVARAGT